MNLKEAAAREAALKTLLDVVEAEYKAARAETRTALEAAAQDTGVRQVAVSLPDGPDIATVSLSSGEAAAKVVDTEAFTAWVRDHYATELERKFVTTVRQAFIDRLLMEVTAIGTGEWADADGVLQKVPGVEIAPARARTHSVRFKKDGREQVMRALREGQLITAVLPELTAGGAE
jgi:hypothetical protein